MEKQNKLFRYVDNLCYELFVDGTELELKEYLIVKETPKGNWIREHGMYGKPKFVLKGYGKRFAHETKEMALNSFICRKKRQIIINKEIIKRAKHSLSIAEGMKTEQEPY